jgi:hypothetical protein
MDRHLMARLPHPVFRIALPMPVAGCVASAQNSDLGMSIGVMATSDETVGRPPIGGSWNIGGAYQVNCAYQVKGWLAGDLYM